MSAVFNGLILKSLWLLKYHQLVLPVALDEIHKAK